VLGLQIASSDVVVTVAQTGRDHLNQDLAPLRRIEFEFLDLPVSGCLA
jgi:hypothetical protein